MTQPIKIQAKHRPAAKPVAVTRQSQPEKPLNSVKKAPAPPPNPHLVNLQDGSSPAAQQPQVSQNFPQNASVPVAAQQPQTNQEHQKPYDQHSDGALTYFNYYFEELGISSKPADYPASPTRAKIPVAAIGAGVVAATIASGAIISNAINQPEAPQSRQPQDSDVKQNTDFQQPRPTTTAPERIETGRSLSSSPTPSIPSAASAKRQPAPALKQTQGTANSLISSGPLVSNAPPLKLSPLSLPSAPPATTSSPTVAGHSEHSGSNSNSLKAATRRELARRIANLPAVAPPETLPPARALPEGSGTTSLPANLDSGAVSTGKEGTQTLNPSPSQVASPPANSQTTAFPPGSGMPTSASQGISSPNIPVSSQPGTTAANSTIPASGMTVPGSNSSSVADSPNRQAISGQAVSGQAVSRQSGIAPGDRLLETGNAALNRVTSTPTTGSPALSPASAPVPLASNTAEGIQDYLNRPPKPAADAPALMPLSSKAAEEAVAKPQIGAFTVRQVSQQDYQKEWQTSNRNPSDPAIAYAFPAYGFIDYQRQVIVVLKEQPNVNPLQSQQITTPNS